MGWNGSTRRIARNALGVVMLGTMMALAAACATPSGVSGYSAIAQARYALVDAELNDADELAPEDMAVARDRLAKAEAEIAQGRPDSAARYAAQSTVTARLASERAALARARARAAEAVEVEREAGTLIERTEEVTEEQR
jgi:hypothetical protein